MRNPFDQKIVVTGAAGLVGQNLCLQLHRAGYRNIIGIDKHETNLDVLRQHQPYVRALLFDLADPGDWEQVVREADVVVINQAQIGGLDWVEFERNNIVATRNILQAFDQSDPPYLVQISSSVVNSQADDYYTRSKTEQENLILASGLNYAVLRPTLMFGWFDRKHLGWLRRFMEQMPIFPIPSHGKYIRQPLYEADFCRVIIGCIEQRPKQEIFDISGQEKIYYKDMIRTIRDVSGAKTLILHIPYWSFWLCLWVAGKLTARPPFTTNQLEALVIPEEFPIIDWPGRFGFSATPFKQAVHETYNDPEFSDVFLEF